MTTEQTMGDEKDMPEATPVAAPAEPTTDGEAK